MEEARKEALAFLSDYQDGAWKSVIKKCEEIKNPFNGKLKEFLDHCTACGGNWGGMFLSGVRKLYPEVWNAIPDEMGSKAFIAIGYVLILCGVDCGE